MAKTQQNAAIAARAEHGLLRGRKSIYRLLTGIVTGTALIGTTTAVQAAELSHFLTVTNTDVATFGIGNLRGSGSGNLVVSGLSGTVSSAYLYWHGPTGTYHADASAYGTFGGVDITGTNIGFSHDNGWWAPYYESQAYRYDVTGIVTGNDTYTIANFLGRNGDMNGMSLIVFYDDGNAANNRDVVLFEGNDSNRTNSFDADRWNATLNGVTYSGGPAEMVLHVSDGQNFSPTDDGTLVFNGSSIGYGGLFQGDSVQKGNGTTPDNGGLWDIKSYDVSALLKTDNTLTLLPATEGPRQDLLSLVVAQFNLPVGALSGGNPGGPTVPGVPEPGTWAMMIAGLGLVGASLRRRTTRVTFA